MWPRELGLGTHNPRFVAWPLELGLETHNPCFVACPLALGLGIHNPPFLAWPMELGLGTHNPRFVAWICDFRECRGDVAILLFSGPSFFLLPFVFAVVFSNQFHAGSTEACAKQSATMSPVRTDDTLRIRMQCNIIAWLFVTLYPWSDEGGFSSFLGKESQTRAKVQCMRGADNQNACPPIVGCYTHWAFWGLISRLQLGSLPWIVCCMLCFAYAHGPTDCVSVMTPLSLFD